MKCHLASDLHRKCHFSTLTWNATDWVRPSWAAAFILSCWCVYKQQTAKWWVDDVNSKYSNICHIQSNYNDNKAGVPLLCSLLFCSKRTVTPPSIFLIPVCSDEHEEEEKEVDTKPRERGGKIVASFSDFHHNRSYLVCNLTLGGT